MACSSRFLIAWALSVVLCSTSYARDAFLLTVETENRLGSTSFSRIEEFINGLSNRGFESLVPAYIPEVSAVTAVLDIRGLKAFVTYAQRDATLVFTVPSLGIREVFPGRTRNESKNRFVDWLKAEGGDVLTRLLQGLVHKSAIDPVAGNPNSLMALMSVADFEMGSSLDRGPTGGAPGAARPNILHLGARFGSFTANDFDTTVYTLPLTYPMILPDPSQAIILDSQFTYIKSAGTEAYSGSLGIGFRFAPVASNKDWTLTPALRLGGVGSEDLGTAALVYSGSIMSNYNLYFNGLGLSIGNLVGVYKTAPLKFQDYKIDYDLTNYVFRNGAILAGPLNMADPLFKEPMYWEAALVHTQFAGDALFVSSYGDLALSVGPRRRPGSPSWQTWRVGVTGTVGEREYYGFRANFGYSF